MGKPTGCKGRLHGRADVGGPGVCNRVVQGVASTDGPLTLRRAPPPDPHSFLFSLMAAGAAAPDLPPRECARRPFPLPGDFGPGEEASEGLFPGMCSNLHLSPCLHCPV